MTSFLSRDFLLSTPTARTLYHQYAASMPIVDYHCHVNPKEIFEDRHFENLTQAWLGADHYKWRLMRANGIEEYYITGSAPDREKFQKFAETLPKAIGSPVYHWCHLELKKYFGCPLPLSPRTAGEIWDLACRQLARPEMGARGLMAQSGVIFAGTTDDPLDSLEWHRALARDPSFRPVVAPSFRPDKALNLDDPDWPEYIRRLSAAADLPVTGLGSLKAALCARMDHFAAHGCKASDHGLELMVFSPAPHNQADAALKKRLAGQPVTRQEAETVKTVLLQFCAGEYARRDWVMQIHYNCLRSPNTAMAQKLGPDTGFDCIGPAGGRAAMAGFLDSLYASGTLPRTILYSLDPGDNSFLDVLAGSFQGGGIAGRIQHGSAWWFNDHKTGIRDHLTGLAANGLLGCFVGMLTDSRSFLSYPRHEYFRRILCSLLGRWAEEGEYPADLPLLGSLVQDICCRNALRYFRLKEAAA